MNKAIHVEGLSKAYSDISGRRVPVLHDLNLDIAPGEVVAIVGASGSGNSTSGNNTSSGNSSSVSATGSP